MRPESSHGRSPADNPAADSAVSPGAARDLVDLLAVVMGVCESLAAAPSGTAQQAELARVGLLAAERAIGLARGPRVQAANTDSCAAPTPAPSQTTTAAQTQARALTLQAAVVVVPARKVLLVEDDPDLLSLLTAAFLREGYETYCARNGRVGVDLLNTLQPDLMVTDIVMPEMEGIAAIIEARRASPHTRVIAISGGGHYGKSQNFLAWAQELGADEVLAKPFRMSTLITAARVVLGRPDAPIPANETTPRRAPFTGPVQASHR